MFENFLMGSGVKLVANLVNAHMQDKAEERKTAMLRDARDMAQHVKLAEITSKDWTSKITRGIIFLGLAGVWCYMGVYGIQNPQEEITVLIPVSKGWFQLFREPEFTTVTITGGTLIYQWYQLMEMVLGAFVVPSRRR